jgi:hypothetical protein
MTPPGDQPDSQTAGTSRVMKPLFPLFPVFGRTSPSVFTTSELLGRAMLRVVQGRADQFILESADINRVGG